MSVRLRPAGQMGRTGTQKATSPRSYYGSTPGQGYYSWMFDFRPDVLTVKESML